MAGLITAGVSAAGAIAGAASGSGGPGGLLGSTLPPNVPTSYTQNTTLPDWYNAQQQEILGQLPAAQHNSDVSTTAALEHLNASGNPSLNKDVFASYMDPYTSSVTDAIQTLGNQNLMENVLPGVNDTFTGAGQFGGNRNAEFENRAIRDNQQATSIAQAGALEHGFDTSLAGYNAGENRGIQAATGYTNVANAQLQPVQTAANILNGMKVPTSISGTSNAPLPGASYGPSPLAGLTSAAQAIPGLVDKISGLGGTPSNTNPATGNPVSVDAAPGPDQVMPMKRGGLARADFPKRHGALTMYRGAA